MPKEAVFYGKSEQEVHNMSLTEFGKFVPSRQRRLILRGFSDAQKILLEKVKVAHDGKRKKPLKTHCRDMIVLPQMLGLIIHVYTGKEYIPVEIDLEKLGHYLGEFALTRRRLVHSAPGLGASRSSAGQKGKK